MKNRFEHVLVGLLCLVFMIAIVGCGDSDSEEPAATEETVATEESSTDVIELEAGTLGDYGKEITMNEGTKVAVIGIVVENRDSVEKLNALLSEYGDYIIGRMGIPYKERNINIISIAIDAPCDVINTLAGSIGRLDGVRSKTACSDV